MSAHRTQKQTKKSPLVADLLLAWYDIHQRDLPWRATKGTQPDPYHVWLSEIMLQQTTVAAVKPYYEKFLTLFPSVQALAIADQHEVLRAWAGLGYYSRARNLHACAKEIVSAYQGQFPDSYALLKALPGIGDYTASAILAIAFGKHAIVIDGNVERVMSRLARIQTPLPLGKKDIRASLEPITPHKRCGDFAQSLMDLGATICTPRNPACGICPLVTLCQSAHTNDVEQFPRKAAKTARPRRFGQAFVVVREDGALLLRNRPEKGLLGGMSEVPNTDWTPEPQQEMDPALAPVKGPFKATFKAPWHQAQDRVRHVFTHFELELVVFAARISAHQKPPPAMRFVPLSEVENEALPTVMKKVVEAGLRALDVTHPRS